MKGFIFAIMILFGGAGGAFATVRTEAVVNGRMIASFDVDTRAALIKALSKRAGMKLPSDEILRAEVFETLVIESIKTAEAEKFRVAPGREEMEMVEAHISQFYGFKKPGELREFVKKNKLGEASLNTWVASDATWIKFAQSVLRAYITVRPNELARPDGAEFEVVPLVAAARVDGVDGAARSCGSFAKFAKEKGVGISGERLFLSRQSMMEELRQAPATAAGAALPTLAGPFEGGGFVSYFLVCSRREAEAGRPLDEGYMRARFELMSDKLTSFERKYLDDLRQRSVIKKLD